MNRRLLHGPMTVPASWEDGLSTRLGELLNVHGGNCVAKTLLYLSVAERLDLPFHAILAPEHVFVRYDDGTTRRNVEVTERGRETDDEEYVNAEGRFRILPAQLERGRYLVPMGKKALLSRLLSNLANVHYTPGLGIEGTKNTRAFEMVERALRFDPRNESALLVRAQIRFELDPSAREEMLADVAAARAIDPDGWFLLAASASIHLNLQEDERALGFIRAALKRAPSEKRMLTLEAARILMTEDTVTALSVLDRLKGIAGSNRRYHELRAEGLTLLGRTDEAARARSRAEALEER